MSIAFAQSIQFGSSLFLSSKTYASDSKSPHIGRRLCHWGGRYPHIANSRKIVIENGLFMKIGILYSSSTGNTEEVAEIIKNRLGNEADDPIEISELNASDINDYDMLIIGAPTWNTGADTERSGTAWDEFLYETLPKIDLNGKPIAVFGLGDAVSYEDNFCDVIEELHDRFSEKGGKMIGYTDESDYEFEGSKSVRDGKFLGCPIDAINGQIDIEERINAWTEKICEEAGLPPP